MLRTAQKSRHRAGSVKLGQCRRAGARLQRRHGSDSGRADPAAGPDSCCWGPRPRGCGVPGQPSMAAVPSGSTHPCATTARVRSRAQSALRRDAGGTGAGPEPDPSQWWSAGCLPPHQRVPALQLPRRALAALPGR